MILVTIGTQLPFDRLIAAADAVAAMTGERFFAQIGRGAYRPHHMRHVGTIPPREIDDRIAKARAVVAHAGIGTVLAAQMHRKPLIVMPREARFGEQRNDHQLATCALLADTPGFYVVRNAEELAATLARPDLVPCTSPAAEEKRNSFVSALRQSIATVLA